MGLQTPAAQNQPSVPQTINKSNTLKSSDLPAPGACGFTVNDRIVGGKVTTINEYPWLVLLEYTKRNSFPSSLMVEYQNKLHSLKSKIPFQLSRQMDSIAAVHFFIKITF